MWPLPSQSAESEWSSCRRRRTCRSPSTDRRAWCPGRSRRTARNTGALLPPSLRIARRRHVERPHRTRRVECIRPRGRRSARLGQGDADIRPAACQAVPFHHMARDASRIVSRTPVHARRRRPDRIVAGCTRLPPAVGEVTLTDSGLRRPGSANDHAREVGRATAAGQLDRPRAGHRDGVRAEQLPRAGPPLTMFGLRQWFRSGRGRTSHWCCPPTRTRSRHRCRPTHRHASPCRRPPSTSRTPSTGSSRPSPRRRQEPGARPACRT